MNKKQELDKDVESPKPLERLHPRAGVQDLLVKFADILPVAVFKIRIGHDGKVSISYLSPALANILGLPSETLKIDPKTAKTLIHPDDFNRVMGDIAFSKQTLQRFQSEWRINLPAQGEIKVSCKATPEAEDDGGVVWFGYLHRLSSFEQAEQQRASHLRFFESMDLVNRAMQSSDNLEHIMSNVLDAMLDIFDCDRAWLVYPCDPTAETMRVPMERTRREYPGGFAESIDYPISQDVANSMRLMLASDEPVTMGLGSENPVMPDLAEAYQVQAFIATALYPKVGKPWSFGMHQCSRPRIWTDDDKKIFSEIGRRLSDGLTSLLVSRDLKESEERFRQAFEFAGIGMGMLALDGHWLRANQTLVDMLGYSEFELQGVFFHALVYLDDLKLYHENVSKLLTGAIPYLQSENRFQHRNGNFFWVRLTTSMVRDADSSAPLYFIVQLEEIHQRKQDEERIAILNMALDRVTEAAYLVDEDAHIHYVNEEVTRMLGYTREEMLNMCIPDLDPEYPIERWRETLQTMRDKGSISVETVNRAKNGTPIPVEVNASYFEYRRQAYILGLVRDITERKQAEQKRLDHLHFFEMLDRVNRTIQAADDFEQLMSDVLQVLLDMMACERAWLMYPCDPDADSWQIPMERTHPDYPGLFALNKSLPMDSFIRGKMKTALASPEPFGLGVGLEYPFEGKIAEQFTIRSELAMALHPKIGKPWIFGIHQCSHIRIWTNEERRLFSEIGRRLADGLTSLLVSRDLKESEERFRQMAENIQEVFWLAEVGNDQMLYVSPAYESIWGIKRDHLYTVPAQWLQAIHPEDKTKYENARRLWQLDGEHDLEYRIINTDGSVRHIHDRAFPIRDNNGNLFRVAGIAQDITIRKQQEAHIHFLAYHDALTGLPNRELVLDRLSMASPTQSGAIIQWQSYSWI